MACALEMRSPAIYSPAWLMYVLPHAAGALNEGCKTAANAGARETAATRSTSRGPARRAMAGC
jgi:hypothetical protein